MSLSFPLNPTLGQEYTAPNGTVYVWDGVKWMVSATVITGAVLTELTQDRMAEAFIAGNADSTGVTFAYNDTANKITASASNLVNGNKTLSLSNTGFITFPNGHTYRPAIGFAAAGNDGNIGLTNVYGNNIIQVRPDKVRIQTNDADTQAGIDNGGHIWDFELDGTLTFPGTLAPKLDQDLAIYTSESSGGGGNISHGFKFTTTGQFMFPDNSVQTGAAISKAALKTLVAASTSFSDFQARIAAL